jgi:outer membrane lipoprotein-sorting protein
MRTPVIATLILLFSPLVCFGENAAQRGYQIAIEADKRASGFDDFTANMEMILRNKQKRESHRKIRISTIETESDGDKSLTIFDSPRDVKGTALLTHSYKTKDDDQWLYLPALKRVKRINSRNKSGSFMGSEFSYEDLGSREVEKYSHTFIGVEDLDGRACFIVERSPKDKKNSGYSRIVSWLDKKEYRLWKEDYYDKKKRFLKTLTLSNYQLFINTNWRPHTMHMVNHQTGKETDLLWSDFSFRTGLSSKDFNKNSLKRAK